MSVAVRLLMSAEVIAYARSALRWTHQDVDNLPPKLCPALMGEIFANELWYNPFIDESSYYRIILNGILGVDLYGRR